MTSSGLSDAHVKSPSKTLHASVVPVGALRQRRELLAGEYIHVLEPARRKPSPLLEAAPAAAHVRLDVAGRVAVGMHGGRRADDEGAADARVHSDGSDRTELDGVALLRDRTVVKPDETFLLRHATLATGGLRGLHDDGVCTFSGSGSRHPSHWWLTNRSRFFWGGGGRTRRTAPTCRGTRGRPRRARARA